MVVLAAGEPRFDGAVFAELEPQAASGTIRDLDATVLFKDEAEQCWSLDLEDLPPARPAPEEDVITRLERLGALKVQGILTEEEFATQKAKLLDT